jgi:anti-sigma regulatory factor (Ser/Thr protein kinase)
MKRESWLPAAPESAPLARAIVREAAIEHGLENGATWDLMLATSEAMTNAIVHGTACDNGNGGKGILLRVLPEDDGLCVEVCDCGRFELELSPAAPDDTHGRGIPIITAVVDEFEVAPEGNKTKVRFSKRGALAAA